MKDFPVVRLNKEKYYEEGKPSEDDEESDKDINVWKWMTFALLSVVAILILSMIVGPTLIEPEKIYHFGSFEVEKSKIDSISETMYDEGYASFALCKISNNKCVTLKSSDGGK